MFISNVLYVSIGGAQDFWFTADRHSHSPATVTTLPLPPYLHIAAPSAVSLSPSFSLTSTFMVDALLHRCPLAERA